jgi:hypothetical protein
MSDTTGSRIAIAYPTLQSPFQPAEKTLRNRLVHASKTPRMQVQHPGRGRSLTPRGLCCCRSVRRCFSELPPG